MSDGGDTPRSTVLLALAARSSSPLGPLTLHSLAPLPCAALPRLRYGLPPPQLLVADFTRR
jgi:hypothetical protein